MLKNRINVNSIIKLSNDDLYQVTKVNHKSAQLVSLRITADEIVPTSKLAEVILDPKRVEAGLSIFNGLEEKAITYALDVYIQGKKSYATVTLFSSIEDPDCQTLIANTRHASKIAAEFKAQAVAERAEATKIRNNEIQARRDAVRNSTNITFIRDEFDIIHFATFDVNTERYISRFSLVGEIEVAEGWDSQDGYAKKTMVTLIVSGLEIRLHQNGTKEVRRTDFKLDFVYPDDGMIDARIINEVIAFVA